MEVRMEKVHSPLGGETLRRRPLAPRLDRLEGKTIGESWNGDFKGDLTFPMIRKLLQERFPGLRIVPYGALPYLHGADDPARQKALAREIAARAKELGCEALISGNGA
jgi:hypothetical protein